MIQWPNICAQPSLPLLTPHRVVHTVERVLHHIVAVQLIYLPQYSIYDLLGLHRVRKEQKLGAGQGFETLESEVLGFEDFDTGGTEGPVAWLGGRQGDGREASGEGVDAEVLLANVPRKGRNRR